MIPLTPTLPFYSQCDSGDLLHLGQGKAGGKPRQKTTGWDKNEVQVKCGPKRAPLDREPESLDLLQGTRAYF